MEWKKDLVAKISGLDDVEQVKWIPIWNQNNCLKFKDKVAEMSEEYVEVLAILSDNFNKYDQKRQNL